METSQKVKDLDVSVESLQKTSKSKFRMFSKSNEKLRQKSLSKSKKKKITYNLSNDLASKFNITEWKEHMEASKFTRS